MAALGTRLLDRTLSHLAATLEDAEQTHKASLGFAPLHSIDPRVKLIAALLLTLAAVNSRRIEPLLCLFLLLVLAALLSGVTWKRLAATWASGLFFAAIIAVPALFTAGALSASLLVLRSEASLTCWLIVIMTTPFNRILRALRALHVPAVLIAIFAMTFRYIFLLVASAQDILLSRRSRIVGHLSPAANRKILISTTGVLLSKSVKMSEDVYHAMTSRGFRGEVRLLDDFEMHAQDWLFLGAAAALSAAIFYTSR